MRYLIALTFLIAFVCSDDRLITVPGYPDDFKPHVYAGYLNTSSDMRYLHYILM